MKNNTICARNFKVSSEYSANFLYYLCRNSPPDITFNFLDEYMDETLQPKTK